MKPFDPDAKTRKRRRKLPHWEQEGCIIFLTFRLEDSLPTAILRKWKDERLLWLQIHTKSMGTDWRFLRDSLPKEDRHAYNERFFTSLDQKLDEGLGDCVLRDPDNAGIVADALRHFDGSRYRLGDFVIMPNHVHVLLEPIAGWKLEQITHSWKRFSAREINRRLGQEGQLWQHESFDHLVRSENYLATYRKYIADNPKDVPAGQFVHSRSDSGHFSYSESDDSQKDKLQTCPTPYSESDDSQRDKLQTCPTLTAIVAMTPERVIGRGGDLPWHLPEDLQFFKRTTSGHPIVMGRKTYDSIGKPLPKRQNIVLTRDASWAPEGVDVIHDPGQISRLQLIDPHAFIIGGAQIYELFLPFLDDLLVSYVRESHPGDTRFPEFEHLFPTFSVLEEHEQFEVRHYHR